MRGAGHRGPAPAQLELLRLTACYDAMSGDIE